MGGATVARHRQQPLAAGCVGLIKPSTENREDRETLTKQAIASIIRSRIVERRLRKTMIARESGISQSYLRALLRAEKTMSIFIFLELSDALRFDDPSQLLREVLHRREQLLAEYGQGDMAR
jgi:AraC-like DNA-binding protein